MMKALIQRTIDLLKKKVKENLETINRNQALLNELLKQPVSAERTYHVDKNYASNKALLSENNDYISLQLTLVNFLEKYKDQFAEKTEIDVHPETDTLSFLDDEELFDLTVQGKIGFENSHPKFRDEIFFNRLLSYYTSREAYEKCNALLSLKKSRQ
ncbi:MAG: hypothetical protein R6X09_01845 [Bacteroidales bacterium]